MTHACTGLQLTECCREERRVVESRSRDERGTSSLWKFDNRLDSGRTRGEGALGNPMVHVPRGTAHDETDQAPIRRQSIAERTRATPARWKDATTKGRARPWLGLREGIREEGARVGKKNKGPFRPMLVVSWPFRRAEPE